MFLHTNHGTVIKQKHGFAVESTIEKYYQRVEPASAFLLSRSFKK